MTEIPELCPLPRDALERQRSLLGVYVASELHLLHEGARDSLPLLSCSSLVWLLVTPSFGLGGRLLDLIELRTARPEVRGPVWSPDGGGSLS